MTVKHELVTSAAAMSRTFIVRDDVEPVPPAPKPEPPAAPPAVVSAPVRTGAFRIEDIPKSVIDDLVADLTADHPGTKWWFAVNMMRMQFDIAVEVYDLLTKEAVGKAVGAVSLLPLVRGQSIADSMDRETDRMTNSVPSPLLP